MSKTVSERLEAWTGQEACPTRISRSMAALTYSRRDCSSLSSRSEVVAHAHVEGGVGEVGSLDRPGGLSYQDLQEHGRFDVLAEGLFELEFPLGGCSPRSCRRRCRRGWKLGQARRPVLPGSPGAWPL